MSEKMMFPLRRLDSIVPAAVLLACVPGIMHGCSRSDDEASSATNRIVATSGQRVEALPTGLEIAFESNPVRTGEAVDAVRARAAAVWEARVANDWARLYDFEFPMRLEGVSREEFAENAPNSYPFRWERAELGPDIYVDGPLAWVFVDRDTLISNFPGMPATNTKSWEVWLQHEDEWYPVTGPGAEKLPVTPELRNHKAEMELLEEFIATWEPRHTGDWRPVYDRLTPEVKEMVRWEDFRAAQELFLLEWARVEWVEVREGKGRVCFAVAVKPNDPNVSRLDPTITMSVEPWVYRDGKWYIEARTAAPEGGINE